MTCNSLVAEARISSEIHFFERFNREYERENFRYRDANKRGALRHWRCSLTGFRAFSRLSCGRLFSLFSMITWFGHSVSRNLLGS